MNVYVLDHEEILSVITVNHYGFIIIISPVNVVPAAHLLNGPMILIVMIGLHLVV